MYLETTHLLILWHLPCDLEHFPQRKLKGKGKFCWGSCSVTQ